MECSIPRSASRESRRVPVWGGGPLGLDVDAAGRIVVTGFLYAAGRCGDLPGYDGPVYGAARLLADGSLDPAFSGDGLLELDAASGLHELGAVHASGSDGAMLAVTEKLGPGDDSPVGLVHDTLVGLVRITADGTIDATNGGGFAQVAQRSAYSDVRSVADFAVDSVGRAVVAVQGDYYGGQAVLRLDAAGGPDPNVTGDPCNDELLAVAARADRWAIARVVAHGIEVRAIDPADPGAIVSATYRSPYRNFSLVGLAISPDGTAAYALGDAFVLRVDLATRKALPHVADESGARHSRRVRRAGFGDAPRHGAVEFLHVSRRRTDG